jgi:hypothetical protein
MMRVIRRGAEHPDTAILRHGWLLPQPTVQAGVQRRLR